MVQEGLEAGQEHLAPFRVEESDGGLGRVWLLASIFEKVPFEGSSYQSQMAR
jgi:hypothetical protein